jgi:hypothetical protein
MTADGISPGTPGSEAQLMPYVPEPSTTGIGLFRDVFQAAGSAAASLLPGGFGRVDGFQHLISAQIQVQLEMQQVSMVSNIEKSRHESRMAAVRNIRVG